MNRSLILTSAALLALAACGDAKDVATEAETAAGDATIETATAVAATPAIGATAPDTNTAVGYASAAALGDRYEIELSQLALASRSAEVRQFAQMMIDAHGKGTGELKSALAGGGIAATLPTALDARRQGLLDTLRGKTPLEFDAAYLDLQAKAHGEALDLHKRYAEGGDNPQLRALAARMVLVVQAHLNLVKGLAGSVAKPVAAAPPR